MLAAGRHRQSPASAFKFTAPRLPLSRSRLTTITNGAGTKAFFLLSITIIWLAATVAAAPQQTSGSNNSGSSNSSSSSNGNNQTQSGGADGNNNATNVTVVPLGTRAHHGLGEDWMQVNSIYIGFLPDWSRENPIDINRELGKSMAIIGDYVDIYEGDTSLSQARYHASAITRLQGLSLYAPAIRPRFTLDKWTEDMSTAVANVAASFNRQGVPVWLRFAWEMNGGWYEYGDDPTNFRSAWISIANRVRATTNETYMLWAPNVRYGETESNAGYQPYYPGEQYVDVAGLSYYAPGGEGKVAPKGSFVQGLSSFYRLYGQQHPIIIAETGAPYTYEIPASLESTYCSDCGVQGSLPDPAALTPMPTDSASEVDMKIGWLNQLISDETAGRYPNLTAVCFFNYFKYGNEHGGNAATLADFRNVGGHGETENQFRQIVGNVSAYQGGYSGGSLHTRTIGLGTVFVALSAISTSILVSYV